MRHAVLQQAEAPRLPSLALTPNLFSIFLLCLQFALHYIKSIIQRVKGGTLAKNVSSRVTSGGVKLLVLRSNCFNECET